MRHAIEPCGFGRDDVVGVAFGFGRGRGLRRRDCELNLFNTKSALLQCFEGAMRLERRRERSPRR